MRKTIIGMVAVLSATFCYGLSWEGVKAVDVPVGTTQTIDASEELTGSGSILKTGGGTLVFSNSGNTFTGGIETREGYVKSTAVGSFGSGDITISGTHTAKSVKGTVGKNTNQVWFAASGTYANTIYYKMKDAHVNLEAPYGVDQATLRVTGNVTLSGEIYLWENGFDVRTNSKNDKWTFTGTVHGKDSTGSSDLTRTIYTWVIGAADFTELSYISLDCSSWAHEGGVVSVRNKGRLSGVTMARAYLNLYADNILNDNTWNLIWTSVVNTYAPLTSGNNGIIDVHGHDQTIKKIVWSAGQKLTSTLNGSAIRSSDGPATITLKQTDYVNNCGMRFDDQINIVYDAANTMVLTTRVHTTTGKLTVKNGTLRLTGDASMASLSAIDVQGGTFSAEMTPANAFQSVTNVTVSSGTLAFSTLVQTPFGIGRYCTMKVEDGGTLTIPTGVEIHVSAFTYHGTPYAAGQSYTDAAWGGGTVYVDVVEASEAVARTWTGGGGADTSVMTAANWGGAAFEPFAFSMLPSFATGGTLATFGTDAYLKGLRFELPAGSTSFTLGCSPADQTRTITLGSLGLRTTRATGDLATTKTYTVNAELKLSSTQNWAAETNDTVVFSQPVTSPQGVTLWLGEHLHFLAGQKTSTFDFAGGLTNFWGDIIVSNGLTKITGSVGSAEHPEGTLYSLGYWGGCTRFYGETTVYKSCNWYAANVATVPGGDVQDTWMTFAQNSTTTFKGKLTCKNSNKLQAEEGSTVIFEGGGTIGPKQFLRGKGTYIFRGEPYTNPGSSSDGIFVEETVKTILAVPDCKLVNVEVRSNGSVLEFRTNHVQSLTKTFDKNTNTLGLPNTYGYGTIDFTTTSQRFERVYAKSTKCKMKGAYPATLETKTLAGAESAICATFEGWLGLSNLGEGTTVVSNTVSQSYGDLYVSAGTLKIDAESSWANGTNVTVTGTGTLKLCANNQLNRRAANLYIGDSGVIDLASGTTTRVKRAYVNGVDVPGGRYTKSTAPATLADHLSGDGSLLISSGTCILIR